MTCIFNLSFRNWNFKYDGRGKDVLTRDKSLLLPQRNENMRDTEKVEQKEIQIYCKLIKAIYPEKKPDKEAKNNSNYSRKTSHPSLNTCVSLSLSPSY